MIYLFVEAGMKEMFTVSVYKKANECDAVHSVMDLQTFQRNLPSLATEYKHVFFLIVPCFSECLQQYCAETSAILQCTSH
jgi:hypothetical protein